MKSDSDIKRDVEAELKWDPDIDATDIAVAAKGGVVTLTGFVKAACINIRRSGMRSASPG